MRKFFAELVFRKDPKRLMKFEAFKTMSDSIIYEYIVDEWGEENEQYKYIFDITKNIPSYLSYFIHESIHTHCILPGPPTLKFIGHG